MTKKHPPSQQSGNVTRTSRQLVTCFQIRVSTPEDVESNNQKSNSNDSLYPPATPLYTSSRHLPTSPRQRRQKAINAHLSRSAKPIPHQPLRRAYTSQLQQRRPTASSKYEHALATRHVFYNEPMLGIFEKSQLVLVCAIVGLTLFVIVERIFIKDDVLLNFLISLLSLIVGYYFGTPKAK